MFFRFMCLAIFCVLPAYAVNGYLKDPPGDIKLNKPELKCMDITSVKVTSSDRKVFSFEVKTRADINVTSDNLYFIVAVNLDGDLATGNSAWTPGQDFCAYIELAGASVKNTRVQGHEKILSAVSIDKAALRFTLTFDAVRQKRMTFNVRSMIRVQSSDGKTPYTVLDSSVPSDERYNELKL